MTEKNKHNGKRIPDSSHGTLSLIIVVVLLLTALTLDAVRAQAQEEITAPIDSSTVRSTDAHFRAEINNPFDDAEMEIYIHYYTDSYPEQFFYVNDFVIKDEYIKSGEVKTTVTVPQAAIKKGKNSVDVIFYEPGFADTFTVYPDSKVTLRKITPSLSLSQITIEPKPIANESVQIKSALSNSGKGAASNITVILLSGEKKVDEEKITGLNPGQSQPVIFNWTAPAGIYVLKLDISASGGYAVAQNVTVEVVKENTAMLSQANIHQWSGRDDGTKSEKVLYFLIFTIVVAAIFFLVARRMEKTTAPIKNTGGAERKKEGDVNRQIGTEFDDEKEALLSRKGAGNSSGMNKKRKLNRKPPISRIVVDGSNVARADLKDGQGSAEQLINAYTSLQRDYDFDEIIIIIGSGLRWYTPDFEKLNYFIDSKVVREAPAGEDDDFFIIQFALDNDMLILTNDRFVDWKARYPELEVQIEMRRVAFMIKPDGSLSLGKFPDYKKERY